MKQLGIYFIFILFLFGCGKKKLNQSDYLQYINSEESGLVQKKTFNNVTYKVKLHLPEMISATADENITKAKFESNMKYYNNKVNFIFIMEDNGSTKVKNAMFDKEKYGAMLSYANTELKNDFKLLNGNDTLYCGLVHLEPANSIQPVIRMTLGFSGIDSVGRSLTLIYNDNIFSNGPLKFYYSKETLNNLPEINLQ
jgi:hypothetical protein